MLDYFVKAKFSGTLILPKRAKKTAFPENKIIAQYF